MVKKGQFQMTNQEKEFVKFIRSYTKDVHTPHGIISCIENYEGMAKAIIAKYPQILAEKVWRGYAANLYADRSDSNGNDDTADVWFDSSDSDECKKIEVFIREVKS